MSEIKYHFKREGNHVKVTSVREVTTQLTPIESIAPKRVKRSILSRIGSFFGILFSGIIMIFGFLIATPFFILGVLWNWIFSFIGLSIFWMFAGIIYYNMILNYEVDTNLIFNNTSIPILLVISLIFAIMATIGRIRD